MMDKKIYKTMVMEGSDQIKVIEIRDMLDMIVGNRSTSTYDAINGHPSKFVIETPATEEDYDMAADVVESIYPGYCTFNALI